jgi:predicted RNA methylase
MSVDERPRRVGFAYVGDVCGGERHRQAERLRRQTTELQSLAAEFLDRVGAAEGQSVIDVGCGPGGILELLAERVGPRGRVVGLEVDPVHVAMARELVAEQGLTNVEVIQADARHTGLLSPHSMLPTSGPCW